MPLIRIDAPHASPRTLDALGRAVHHALIDAFGIPMDDRFQILRGGSGDRVIYDANYLGIHRDDDIAVIQVFLRDGRSEDKKQTFYRAVAKHAESAGFEPRNLIIVLTENTLADWSFGNGRAQYLEAHTATA